MNIKRNKKARFCNDNRRYYREEYLKSDHWKELRKVKLKLNPNCEQCGSKTKIEPHHLQYKNLYDVTVEDLQTLCRKCHKLEHLKIENKLKNESRARKEFIPLHKQGSIIEWFGHNYILVMAVVKIILQSKKVSKYRRSIQRQRMKLRKFYKIDRR